MVTIGGGRVINGSSLLGTERFPGMWVFQCSTQESLNKTVPLVTSGQGVFLEK